MVTTTRLEIPEWTGSALTVGAFSEFAGRVVDAFNVQGYANLALAEIGPELEAAAAGHRNRGRQRRREDATRGEHGGLRGLGRGVERRCGRDGDGGADAGRDGSRRVHEGRRRLAFLPTQGDGAVGERKELPM